MGWVEADATKHLTVQRRAPTPHTYNKEFIDLTLQIEQTPWKTLWQILIKGNMRFSHDPATLLLCIYPGEVKKKSLCKDLYMNVS